MSQSSVSLYDPESCWRDLDAKSIGYFTKRPLRVVDPYLIAEIKSMALESGDNVRLSLHAGPDDPFHEMIIFQHGDKYYRPKKHIEKDKSFHMLEGEMGVFVFEEDGELIDARRLSRESSPIYRVAKGLYHTDIPITDYVIHHESTLGPFLGDKDRVFAPWSTDPDSPEAFAEFRKNMINRLNEFE